MNIGIIVAIPDEMNTITEQADIRYMGVKAGKPLYNWRFKNEYYLILSGVGKINAASATQALIDAHQLDLIINLGIAGCINRDICLNTIILADKITEYDMNCSGNISERNTVTLNSLVMEIFDKMSNLYEFEDKLKLGHVLSGDSVSSSQDKSNYLRQIYNGDCVEMESAAVAKVAKLNGMPAVILKYLTDYSNEAFKKDMRRNTHNASNFFYKLIENIDNILA